MLFLDKSRSAALRNRGIYPKSPQTAIIAEIVVSTIREFLPILVPVKRLSALITSIVQFYPSWQIVVYTDCPCSG